LFATIVLLGCRLVLAGWTIDDPEEGARIDKTAQFTALGDGTAYKPIVVKFMDRKSEGLQDFVLEQSISGSVNANGRWQFNFTGTPWKPDTRSQFHHEIEVYEIVPMQGLPLRVVKPDVIVFE